MEEINRKWKAIWEKREPDSSSITDLNDAKNVFMELKRLDGFDVVNGGLSYDALMEQYEETKKNLFVNEDSFYKDKSIFEVGCGSGANLYLFEQDNYKVGGVDYSEKLIETAVKVLKSDDVKCLEAKDISIVPEYDVTLSNSVFSYFPGYEYAKQVLELMYAKTRYAIGLIDIHDIERKDDFIDYRKREVEDYEERYKDLPKLFYERQFFEKFANEHDMDIVFMDSKVKGYWNNEYIFNCYLYKRVKNQNI